MRQFKVAFLENECVCVCVCVLQCLSIFLMTGCFGGMIGCLQCMPGEWNIV